MIKDYTLSLLIYLRFVIDFKVKKMRHHTRMCVMLVGLENHRPYGTQDNYRLMSKLDHSGGRLKP